jgi:hypothetical protein
MRRAVGEMPGSQLPLRSACHSDCHSPQVRYLVADSKNRHDLGAPLRNPTVDLHLTMNRRRVQLSQVGPLIRQNTSTH